MNGRHQIGKNVTVSPVEENELSRVTKLSQMVFYKVSTMIYKMSIVIMGPDILFQLRKECQIRSATLKSDRWILQFAISVFCDGSHAVGNHVMYLVVLDIKQEILSVSEENTKSVQRTA